MSEETNNNAKTPAKAVPTETESTVPAEPARIPAGHYGALLEGLGHAVTHLGPDAKGTEMLRVAPEAALALAHVLRDGDGFRFDLMLLVTGMDWKTHRESVYHLYSTETHASLILKIEADATDASPSLYPVWPAVDWHEREAYDLLGIHYEGHPDLRRILMPTYWVGHPLRKDYKEEDPRLIWNRR
jgi:NADH:ubiquinone oxidoreductase subunit C